VYGLSLLGLFTFSTIYHSASLVVEDPHFRLRLKTLDYIAIYFLIAGTYTPMLLVNIIKVNIHNNLKFLRTAHTSLWVYLDWFAFGVVPFQAFYLK